MALRLSPYPAIGGFSPSLCFPWLGGELLDILFSQEVDFKPDHAAQSRGLARIISNPEIGPIIVARQDGQAWVWLILSIEKAIADAAQQVVKTLSSWCRGPQ